MRCARDLDDPPGLNLVPHMTVAENIWLGREPMKYGFVDHGQLTRQTERCWISSSYPLTGWWAT